MTPQRDTPLPDLVFWLTWGLLAAATIVYAVILQSGVAESPPQDQNTANAEDSNLVQVFALVGLLNLVISFGVRFVVVPRFAGREDAAKRRHAFSACIVSWGLAEAVAIYGLVLGLTGEPLSTSGMFCLASFAALVLQAPTFASFSMQER